MLHSECLNVNILIILLEPCWLTEILLKKLQKRNGFELFGTMSLDGEKKTQGIWEDHFSFKILVGVCFITSNAAAI